MVRTKAKSGMNLKKRLHESGDQLKNPSIRDKDENNKDKKFSPKITSPALELTGLHLQVPRGGTHLNGVGSELTFFLLTRDIFSTLSSLCTHHLVAQGVARRVCIKRCSCTCHHMSERLLFPCFVFFLCLSCLNFLSHFYLFSVLNFNLHDVENAEHQTQCAPAR